jgi:hypothetical protein
MVFSGQLWMISKRSGGWNAKDVVAECLL